MKIIDSHSSNHVLEGLLSLFVRRGDSRMLFRIDLLIDRVLLLNDALWHSNVVPLRAAVMHPVHQLAVAPDVLRVCIRAVPVAELRLLSQFVLALDQLSVAKDISPGLRDAFLLLRLRLLALESDVTVQVHI